MRPLPFSLASLGYTGKPQAVQHAKRVPGTRIPIYSCCHSYDASVVWTSLPYARGRGFISTPYQQPRRLSRAHYKIVKDLYFFYARESPFPRRSGNTPYMPARTHTTPLFLQLRRNPCCISYLKRGWEAVHRHRDTKKMVAVCASIFTYRASVSNDELNSPDTHGDHALHGDRLEELLQDHDCALEWRVRCGLLLGIRGSRL